MKKFFIGMFFLLAISLAGFAQGSWDGFFLPVNKNSAILKEYNAEGKLLIKADSTYNIRLFRGAAAVEGVKYLYNKTNKDFVPGSYGKIGVGMSWSFYKIVEGTPINYLSLNGFVFMPVSSEQNLSIAATIALYNVLGFSPQFGIDFEPALVNSEFFPVGPLVSLKYNF
jgi:hypothetical protein